MKTKLVFTALLIIAVIFGFKNSSEESKNKSDLPPKDNEFLITAMHVGEVDPNYIYFPDLGANAWHKYTGPDWGWPGISNDNYSTPTADYRDAVLQRIDNNRNHGFRSIMDRPKIEYLSFGQKSEYQCEDVSRVDPDLWFYTYKTHTAGQDFLDTSQFGNNQWVKYCQVNPDSPGVNQGYVVKDLKANREQANRNWPAWIADSAYKWYVMPKIRIPIGISGSTPVCKIEVLDWDGDLIKVEELTAEKFRSNQILYNGRYMEEFYFDPDEDSSAIEIPSGAMCPGPRRDFSDWVSVPVNTDFRVYWYGECDMWIDYVKVENLPAHQLFKGQWDQQIKEETDIALEIYDPSNPIPNNFYIEEFEFNIVSAMSYVDSIIQNRSQNKISLMVNLNYPLFSVHIPLDNNNHRDELSASYINKHLIEKAKLKYIVNMSYPLEGFVGNLYPVNNKPTSAHPNTLSQEDYDAKIGILSYKVSPQEYENWLQEKLDVGRGAGDGFIKVMKKTDSLTKYFNHPDLKLIHLAQAHSWWARGHKLKEPSNEEMSLMVNLSLSYGAKGIMYFAYGSKNESYDTTNGNDYTRGLANTDGTPRDSNVYGQDKWEGIKKIDSTLNKWGPYLINFDNDNRKSFICSFPSERTDMSNNTFIRDMSTFPADPLYYPVPDPDVLSLETNNDTYLQASFFQKENETEQNRYFMIINKRCSPFINYNTADNIGGKRFVFMRVNSTNLQGFNNWKIIDLETGDSVLTFNKNDTAKYLYLGEYEPGEGRLYRVAPVMQEGGTLVADEECGGDIECKGEVNNNGKNIFLKPGTNISFADHTARIKMTGGVFKSGHSQTQNSPVYLKGKDNCSWKGISLFGCDSVLIKDTHFSNISPYPVDSTYAVDMINCKFINIETGSFVSEGSLNAGCIRSGYVTNEDVDYSACIQGNTFETDEGEIPALSFIATAGLTLPLIIDGNIFTSASSEGSSNAVLLSNISGGVLKNNTVSEYINSIIMLSSSMDLYNNTITSGIDNSAGIQLYSFSTAFLKPSGMYYTGGYNDFTNLGDGSRNIELLTSYFNIYKGYNVFNVESNSDYHLIGSVYLSDLTNPTQNAKLNCFQFDGTNTAENQGLVWDNSGMPAEYIFTPYSCEIEEPIAYEVFNFGDRVKDTIYFEESGTGGGKSNYELGIKNYELRAKAGKDASRINNKKENTEITTLTSLADSIGINIRRRNYEKVSEDCMNILTNYPDSLESIGIISKLYLAELRLDSTGSKFTGLKTFLESLILNHPNNTALVKQAFYYIQKCKVSLKQYESAMTGFLEIMDENPYSYEGLVASWDYSATSLLFEGGSGAGNSNYELGIENYELKENEMENSDDEKSQIRNSKSQISNDGSREDEIENRDDEESQIRNSKSQISNDDPNDKYDTKTFTKEDRKFLRENVFNIFEISKEIETEKVRSLEKKNEEGKASKEERTELEKKKTLSETIKARKPADAFEHIKFVNNDIQKVFGVSGRGSEKEPDNIIPNEYSLSQNYPNPFNPITHLEFGISELGFVSLKVYDILGKEVKTLVKEIKPAGNYRVEFDGSNFASGVYFYRLEAGDYVQTKRMVLIK